MVLWDEDPRILRVGGLINVEHLDGFHRMICAYCEDVFQSTLAAHQEVDYADQLSGMSLVFVDNPAANALALEQGKHRCIAIYLGLLRQIWAGLRVALTDGEFISPLLHNPPPSASRLDQPVILTDPIWHSDLSAPWTMDRINALHDLFPKCMQWIIYHELAHHARGHLPFLKQELGVALINEALNFSIGDKNNRLLRFIEFDADFHALDMLLVAIDQTTPLRSLEELDWHTLAFSSLVCIIVVFMIFDVDQLPIDEQYINSHPPPVHRAMRITNTLVDGFAQEFSLNADFKSELHDEAWYSASRLAETIGMVTGRWHGDDTNDMGLARLLKEENDFIVFSQRLDAINQAND